MDLTKAELDRGLESLAIDLYLDTPGTDAHHTIGTQIWGHIRAMEYNTGRLLVFGPDADLLAGGPSHPRHVIDITGNDDEILHAEFRNRITLVGDLPYPGPLPHRDLHLDLAQPEDFHDADIVIANLPYVDARALSRDRQLDITVDTHRQIRHALTWLRPGGLLVALAHRQFLDGPDTQPRYSITKYADLIAAARLPAHALRRAPLLDSPVDLLMLRRREPDHPSGGLPFVRRKPVHVHAHEDMLINECYVAQPWAVLGNIVPDPIQPDITTATPMSGSFGPELGDVLHEQTTIAIENHLYAQTRPALSAPPRPGPPANPPHSPAPRAEGPSL